MWLFTLNSFVSVVRHREDQERLLVRARRRDDLVGLLGVNWGKEVWEDLHADYRYRATLSEKAFKKIISGYISRRLDYDNYKAAQKPDREFLNFLHEIWQLGYEMQLNPESLSESNVI
jgi:hypothetical protein